MPLRGHVSFLGDLKHNILRNSSMENNFAIPSARQKAESVFVEVNEFLCLQVFSGVEHGFMAGGDIEAANFQGGRGD